MIGQRCQERLQRCSHLMKEAGLDALLLTKPANMFYLMVELEQTLHGILKEAGHGEHIFGPPIYGVGIEFEEAPLPPGHAFFHGEKAPPPLAANVVIAVGNCGLYTGPWGVRVEDTAVVGPDGPTVLTGYPRLLVSE